MNFPELLRRHRLKIITSLVLAVLAGCFLYVHRDDLSWDALVAEVRAWPVVWFIVAFMILPLFGFPISVFLILSGVRFGLGGGMLVAGSVVTFHKLVAYHLVRRWFRDEVSRRLRAAGYAIPGIRANRQVAFTLMFNSVRGFPYFVKLYLLALTNISAWVYFGVGAPVHIVFCSFSVAVGAAAIRLDSQWTYLVIAFSVGVIAACYWLRHHFIDPAAEPDGTS